MTVNWWLVTLAFVLGMVITLGFTVRRVETGDDSDTARVTDEHSGKSQRDK